MRPRPSLRRACKWTLTGLATVGALLWGASMWRGLRIHPPRPRIGAAAHYGAVLIAWTNGEWIDDCLVSADKAEIFLDQPSRSLFLRSYRAELEGRLISSLKSTLADFDHPLWWINRQPGARWPERFPSYSPEVTGFAIPIWMVLVGSLVPAMIMWWPQVRGTFRKKKGLCSCGYDRDGLAADAKCPECGTVPTLPSE